MTASDEPRRHRDRPRTRRPGAGRPRKETRDQTGPVDAEIVGAASRLFATQGVGGTTMAQIAEAVGLGVSSIYYYFANKQEVLERLVDEVNRIPLAIADDVAERFERAPERLHAFSHADVMALCDFPFDFSEVHRLASKDLDLFAAYWADRRRLLSRIEGFVAEGIADGDVRPVDPALAAVTLLANDEAVQNWHRGAGEVTTAVALTPNEIAAFVADMNVRALVVDPDRWDATRSMEPGSTG